jgi:hypothetical protein
MAPRPVSLARDGCKIRELPLTTLSKTASAIVERSEQLRRRHRDPVMIFRDMDEGNVWRAANLLVQRHSIMPEVIAAMGVDRARQSAWRGGAAPRLVGGKDCAPRDGRRTKHGSKNLRVYSV